MKKITLSVIASLLLITGAMAQSIQDGMAHLYAKRHKSAADVFQKLIAINPNNAEAIYWLGQTYFNMDDNAAARALYEKGVTSTNNHPLMMVGLGHADLLDNKNNDARQKFEAAITASRGRKGDDPVIQTAIGRAIVDSKTGDFNYAVQLLQSASEKDPKNTETLLQLGNAYRKAGGGSGGGEAYKAYKRALEVNPNFAVASVRLAKLFESQKNWDFVLQYLTEATTKDAKFSDAYYELFWYHFLRKNFTEANAQLKKYIDSKLPETDIQDEYLNGQLCYVSKDYDCAIAKATAVLNASGGKAKPRIYKLLAYSYFDKGDYNNALVNVKDYFAKEKAEDIVVADWKLYADIIAKTGGTPEEVYDIYVKGSNADTTVTGKVEFLKQGTAYFKTAKIRDREAMLLEKILEIKPKPTLNDYFDLTVAHYFTPNYPKARSAAQIIVDKYPEEVYGYEWRFNAGQVIDSVKKDSIAVPDALSLNEFAFKDTVKFRKQYVNSSRFLADYYINTARDRDSSLVFFQKWLDNDTANAAKIQEYIDQIRKMPTGTKGATPQKGTTPSKSPGNKPAAAKPNATSTKSGTAVKAKSTTTTTKVVKK